MSTTILRNTSSLTPQQEALLPILRDTSPRPDGTLTRYEEKVRLALPLLREQLSRIPSSVREAKGLDDWSSIDWLHSHWTNYPEPSDSFISKTE